MAVFVISAELGSLSVEFRREGYSGGFVNCVVEADDIETAIAISRSALVDDGYEIRMIDSACLFEPAQWDGDEEVFQLATSKDLANGVLYTTFEVFGS